MVEAEEYSFAQQNLSPLLCRRYKETMDNDASVLQYFHSPLKPGRDTGDGLPYRLA
jgi:hypothetical protein